MARWGFCEYKPRGHTKRPRLEPVYDLIGDGVAGGKISGNATPKRSWIGSYNKN